jgi:hypothetical protein
MNTDKLNVYLSDIKKQSENLCIKERHILNEKQQLLKGLVKMYVETNNKTFLNLEDNKLFGIFLGGDKLCDVKVISINLCVNGTITLNILTDYGETIDDCSLDEFHNIIIDDIIDYIVEHFND